METSRTCPHLDSEIASLIEQGYRLDMIMPADAPREAVLSKGGETLRLKTNPKSKIQNSKSEGRAGMVYRDLLPDRLGGRVIASHISITKGGEVADYVHYHKIKFQMIYCLRGWVRVVYEDQGSPFVLNAGDCVLQPPEIRHRVLKSSVGAEVIEVGSPAEHETWVEHDIQLPTTKLRADRLFSGQKFVRYISAEAEWKTDVAGKVYSDTGIRNATDGLADVRLVRFDEGSALSLENKSGSDTFFYILEGGISLDGKNYELDECILIRSGDSQTLTSTEASELLQITLPR